jgi:hypothetical protein
MFYPLLFNFSLVRANKPFFDIALLPQWVAHYLFPSHVSQISSATSKKEGRMESKEEGLAHNQIIIMSYKYI